VLGAAPAIKLLLVFTIQLGVNGQTLALPGSLAGVKVYCAEAGLAKRNGARQNNIPWPTYSRERSASA